MSNVDCRLHGGKENEVRRRPYDAVMRELPRNQAGEGLARHACAICAYERGRTDYKAQVAKFLECDPDELPMPDTP